MRNLPPTLCWECQRAVRKEINGIRCPWSHDFIPVDGWDAIQTRVLAEVNGKTANRRITSYCVKSCPLFLEDEPQRKLTPAEVLAMYIFD